MSITLKIAGSDKAGFLQDSAPISFDLRAYERGTATARLFDPALSYRATVGQSAEVWKDGTKIFAGSIDSVKETRFATAATPRYQDLAIVGYAQILDRRFVRPSYYVAVSDPFFTNMTPREILDFLVTDQLAGEGISLANDGAATSPVTSVDGSAHFACTYSGLTFTYVGSPLVVLEDNQAVRIASYPTDVYYVFNATSTTFQLVAQLVPAATGPTDFTGHVSGTLDVLTVIDRITYNYVLWTDLLDSLAAFSRSSSGVGGYAWWVDESLQLHFAPATATTAPFNLTDSSANFRNMVVTVQRADYRNSQLVRVDYKSFSPEQATFTGDGVTVQFSIGGMIASIDKITVNGAEVKAGILNQSEGMDWYFSPGDTSIIQTPGATVLTGADTLVVNYYRLGSDVQTYDDFAEQTARGTAEGNTGLYQNMLDLSQSTDGLGAQRLAAALERQYGQLAEVIDYETDTDGLRPGQYQNINVTAFGLNGYFLIVSVRAVSVSTKFLRYTVQAIGQVNKKVTAVDVFKSLASGSGSSSAISGGGGGSSLTPVSAWSAEALGTSGSVTPDGAKTYHTAALTGNLAIGTMTGAVAGQEHTFKITCNGFAVTWDAAFTGLTSVALDTRSGVWNLITFTTEIGGTAFTYKSSILGAS